jgi:hypothetical protein
VNLARIAKPHFELGRMCVDIDHGRSERQIQDVCRIAPVEQHIAISQTHSVHQQPVADAAAVYKPELLIRGTSRSRRQSQPAADPYGPCRMLERQRLLQEIVADDGAHPCLDRLQGGIGGLRVKHDPLAIAQLKTDVRARQGQALDQAHDMTGLGHVAAYELASRRNVEEQVAHFDGGAHHMRRGTHVRAGAAFGLDLHRMLRLGRARQQAQPRHRRNRGHGLAAKPQRDHRSEVIHRGDLAGRMPLQRQGDFTRCHADAIIAHADQPDAAALDVDLDTAGAGVEAVLHQFLDHRSRALNDFAGSDLVDEFVRKDPNRHVRESMPDPARESLRRQVPPCPPVAPVHAVRAPARSAFRPVDCR